MGKFSNYVTRLLVNSPAMQSKIQEERQAIMAQFEKSAEVKLRSILEGRSYYNNDETQVAQKSDFLRLYQMYVWVYACVYAIATSAAKVPLRIYKLTPDDKRGDEITDGPAWNLLYRPNPFQCYFDFLEACFSTIELTGDCYIEKNAPDMPTQLYVLRPDKMEVRGSRSELVSEYIYNPNGTTIRYKPDEILHIKYFNPLSELYGQSSTGPSANSLILDFFAIKYQKNFFKQGAMLNTYVSVPKNLGDKEFARMKAELRENYGGVDRAGLLGLLDNDAKLLELGIDPSKFMLKEQRSMNRDEVLAAYGVPPVMVGLLDAATFNNTEQQLKAFWSNTMTPKLKKFEDRLNMEFYWPLDMEAEFDLTTIPALQEDAEKKANTATKLTGGAAVLTPNEARERFYNLKPLPGGDTLPEQKPQGFAMIDSSKFQKACKPRGKSKVSLKKAKAELLEFDNLYEKYLPKYDAHVSKSFKEMMNKVLKAVNSRKGEFAKQDLIEAALAAIDTETAQLAEGLALISDESTLDAMKRKYKTIKNKDMSPETIKGARKSIGHNVETWAERSGDSIVDTMKGRVKFLLRRAQDENLPIDDVTSGIQGIFEGSEREQYPWARMIARTETNRSINTGKFAGMKSAGILKKEWIPGGGPNARDWHDGFGELGPVPIDYVYQGEHSQIRYPGDPEAEPGELCNCRCTIIEVIDDIGNEEMPV